MGVNNIQNERYRLAIDLSIFTIVYNIIEGSISIYFSAGDEALTLFGFGADSIIEVVSGIGIFIMLQRIKQANRIERSKAERLALRITGISFYGLVALLILAAVSSVISRRHPSSTFSGIVISSISIIVMSILSKLKIKTGRALNSKPVFADGKCTLVCVYMSIILLVSSLLFEWTHISYIDVVGSLALCWFCFSEGKEALQNANSTND